LTRRRSGATLESAAGSSPDPRRAGFTIWRIHEVLLLGKQFLEDMFMAKALLGYVGGDTRLLDDIQRLRRRVAELEAMVLRLQAENDALAAQVDNGQLLMVPDSMSARAHASA
jgi:hypothetical protein